MQLLLGGRKVLAEIFLVAVWRQVGRAAFDVYSLWLPAIECDDGRVVLRMVRVSLVL